MIKQQYYNENREFCSRVPYTNLESICELRDLRIFTLLGFIYYWNRMATIK